MKSHHIRLALLLGWHDIRQRYRRSAIGQFWITISIGVMVACLAFLFSALFQSPIQKFLPFLAIGLICWNFISSTITEGCEAFVAGEGIIKQLNLPLEVHIARVVWRNLIVFAHNLLIVPIVFLVLSRGVSWSALLFLPGLLLVILNLFWVIIGLAIICTRFRDMPQIIQSLLQVAFYLTPIIWLPELLEGKREFALVESNPFYHLIELIRAPLLGHAPTLSSWGTGIGLLAVGGLMGSWLHRRLGWRVAYWL